MSIKEKLKTTYLRAKEIMDKKSIGGSGTNPYRSGEVLKLLMKNLHNVENLFKETDATDPDYEFLLRFRPLLLLVIGIFHVDREELSEGVKYLKKSIGFVENPFLPTTVYVSVVSRNHLGYVSLRRSNAEEALKFLKEAEKIYSVFKSHPGRVPKNILEDTENCRVSDEEELETAHTMTKFYLAQAYEALNEAIKSSVYCHETLKRQLKHKNLDPIDWALTSTLLCEFFMNKMLYRQARNLLAAATHVLDEYGNSLDSLKGPREEIKTKKEEFRHRSADLSWCWAKYGLILLRHSRYKLLHSKDDIVDEHDEHFDKLTFENLDLSRYEDQVTDAHVTTFEDARQVFLFSQKQFNLAKEYYTLEDRASKHVQLVQNHSQLFSALSEFEPDQERQFKMLKKRAVMLKVVLKELNPRYYMDICRELWFEVGEIYHDMMQIRAEKNEKVRAPQDLEKVNSLIESSAKYFNHFIDSVKNNGNLPDPLEEDLIVPTLTAHFYLGRLHFKYMTVDKNDQAEYLKKACESFKYLIDYCERYDEAKDSVEEKYQISKEMISLLKLKLLQL